MAALGPTRGTNLHPVPVDPTCCPDCGAGLEVETIEVAALFRHGGHGATRRSVSRFCTCGWSLLVEVGETRPRR